MKKSLFILFVLCGIVMFVGCNSATEVKMISDVTPTVVKTTITGAELYAQTCQSCHGENGIGVQGFTSDMASSDRLHHLDKVMLIAFINDEHPATEVTEPELLQIIAWLGER